MAQPRFGRLQRPTAARGWHVLTSRTAGAALVAALIQLGCQSGGADTCRPPTLEERTYPFTGVWTAGPRTPICLFQQNPQTVVGEYRGLAAAGLVQRDGELVLSVADRTGGVTVYSVRLSGGDTLDVEVRVATGAALGDPAGIYIRGVPNP